MPQIDNAGRLRLRIVDSKLTDANGGAALGFIWELSKRYVHPRLERFSYDLGASRAALASIVRGAAPPQHAAELEAAVKQLQVLGPRVEAKARGRADRARITRCLARRASAGSAVAAAPAAPLTEAELEALEKALEPWDAFLLYAVKQVALDSENTALRRRLFTLLLESRYRLTEILSGDAPAAGDPLRELFVDAWEELRTILADGQRDGALDASLLRYAAFIDAGDALLALDRAAPGLGMTLSTDGLRQIARSLRPGAAGDPLAYDWAADPQLRQLFGVEEIPRFRAAAACIAPFIASNPELARPLGRPRLRRRAGRRKGAGSMASEARRARCLRSARRPAPEEDRRGRAAAREPRRAVRRASIATWCRRRR